MKKSIFILTITVCTISTMHAMEKTEYTNSMEINSPISQALLTDYQSYIAHAYIKKANAHSVRTLALQCILKIIRKNIPGISRLPDELQEIIIKDSEYIRNNPTLYNSKPCTSPAKKRFKLNPDKKTKQLIHTPQPIPTQRRLFIKE